MNESDKSDINISFTLFILRLFSTSFNVKSYSRGKILRKKQKYF